MQAIESLIGTMNNFVWAWPSAMPLIIVLLVGTGILTTIRLGFVQIRYFRHGLRVVRGEYDLPEHEGDLSHFQALTTALSATVGIGNIAGVALAIHFGGPGAIFWMWVTAVFGMALKYTECTLAQRYRVILPHGSAAGGPMYTIEQGLGRKWKPMAIFFAVFAVICSFGTGNMAQSNTVAEQLRADFDIDTWISGVGLALLVGAVILGGVKRIGQVTSKLVPFMAALYIGGGLLVLALNASEIPSTLALIFTSAFKPAPAIGGFAGSSFMFMLIWGIKRGLFSNEAGQGSAAIAHAAARTDQPIREGMVAMLGPFIDTLVICTMTGLVILVTGVWHEKHPQNLQINAQSDIVALAGQASVGRNASVDDADLATGRFSVREGVPTGLVLVVNHGSVDEPMIRDAEGEPFRGTITFTDLAPGSLADAVFEGENGLAAELRLEGLTLLTSSTLTTKAFQRGLASVLGENGSYLVSLAVLLFALSTIISWSYYGDRSTAYLFGEGSIPIYRFVYCAVIIFGAIKPVHWVWDFGDLALGLMTAPNLICILVLTGVVVKMTNSYIEEGGLKPPQK